MFQSFELNYKYINKTKLNKINNVLNEYRINSKTILNIQLLNLFKTGNILKFVNTKKLNNSKLSQRYLQNINTQIKGMLDSYISNRQLEFTRLIYKSNLDKEQIERLKLINYRNLWFSNEEQIITYKKINYQITKDDLFLARKIWKQLLKINNLPNTKYINMQLDFKVCEIENKITNKAKKFDYWLNFSTLEKGKPIKLPIQSNDYYENNSGIRKNSTQFNFKDNKLSSIVFTKESKNYKELENKTYIPKVDKIAIDFGLRNLFSCNDGKIFGLNFIDKLLAYDNKIQKLQKVIQKQGNKLKDNKRYKQYSKELKSFIKNEVNRNLNNIVNIYKPQEIVLEDLMFKSPTLSKRMNRLLSNTGLKVLNNSLTRLTEKYGIIITYINPAYTSQECNCCGYIDKKNRKSQKFFECLWCGNKIQADVGGSKTILVRSSDEYSNITLYTKKEITINLLVKKFVNQVIEKERKRHFQQGLNNLSLDKFNNVIRNNKHSKLYLKYFYSFKP